MASLTVTENTTSQNTSDTPTSGVEDARILEVTPTQNYGSGSQLAVGNFGAGDLQHFLLRFDTSSIPNTDTISSANLYLRNSANGGAQDLAIYEQLQTWTESGVTWNTYDGTNSWNTAGSTGSGTDRGSSPILTQTVGSTTGVYVSFSIPVAYISKTGDTLLHVTFDGASRNGDYVVFDSSNATDGNRPELEVIHSAASPSFPPQLTTLGVG